MVPHQTDGDDYGVNPIVAMTAVECPSCGYAEVAEKEAGQYQCSKCLKRFGSTEATFYTQGENPADAGAQINENY